MDEFQCPFPHRPFPHHGCRVAVAPAAYSSGQQTIDRYWPRHVSVRMHASLGMPEPHHAAVGESTDSWNRVSQSVPCSALVHGRKKRI